MMPAAPAYPALLLLLKRAGTGIARLEPRHPKARHLFAGPSSSATCCSGGRQHVQCPAETAEGGGLRAQRCHSCLAAILGRVAAWVPFSTTTTQTHAGGGFMAALLVVNEPLDRRRVARHPIRP